ncbi:LpqB family beta-propeller domain-containing protein [Rothia halotolerans]|uniref:LpqB family beta-propeller domain-containing protein n=1 Tax=Rothia halotolerans TaxID=405770 RepID=UPI00101D6649|nr:LpqB family beta-propeller domain-containing protein [Rothia halotolerans]
MSAREPRTRTRRAWLRAAAAGCAALVALTGCGQIPTDGPVYHYAEDGTGTESPEPRYSPEAPADGAEPQELLRGFIAAGTGVEDDYSVAREYLTPELASTWSPEEHTWVYRDEVSIEPGDSEEQATLEISVGTSIDDRGIATSYQEPDEQSMDVEFERVDGQWRISAVPHGTMLSRTEFEQLFQSYSLYFYDPTFSYAVPDVRWFASRPAVVTSLISVLLRGPAPYLESAVSTAVPEGTTLQRSSVPLSGETAEIALSGDQLSEMDQTGIERMYSQFEQTLQSVSAVTDITVSVDDRRVEDGRIDDYTPPSVDPSVPEQQVGVLDGALVSYLDGRNTTISGIDPPAFEPALPAMNAGRDTYAYLDRDRRRLGVRTTDGQTYDAEFDAELSAPGVDRRGWTWAGTSAGEVLALSPDALGAGPGAEPDRVGAAWLAGQSIQSLQVSRDGTRALVVTGEADAARVWVAGIERDDAGAPQRLGEPLRVGTDIQATEAHWISDSSMVVADTGGDSVQIVSLSGEITGLNGLSGIEHLSAGNGQEAVYAQTESGVFELGGTSWTRVSTDVRDLAFSG